MKLKFKDGTIIEVSDAKDKSKEEIISEAKKVYKDFKDSQKYVKDSLGNESREELKKYLDNTEMIFYTKPKIIYYMGYDENKDTIYAYPKNDKSYREFENKYNRSVKWFDPLDNIQTMYVSITNKYPELKEIEFEYKMNNALEEYMNELYDENGKLKVKDSKKVKDSLSEEIEKLYNAIISKDKKTEEKLRKGLERLGMDRFTQNELLKDLHKEKKNTKDSKKVKDAAADKIEVNPKTYNWKELINDETFVKYTSNTIVFKNCEIYVYPRIVAKDVKTEYSKEFGLEAEIKNLPTEAFEMVEFEDDTVDLSDLSEKEYNEFSDAFIKCDKAYSAYCEIAMDEWRLWGDSKKVKDEKHINEEYLLHEKEPHYTIDVDRHHFVCGGMYNDAHNYVSPYEENPYENVIYDTLEEAIVDAKKLLEELKPKTEITKISYTCYYITIIEWSEGGGHGVDENGENIGILSTFTTFDKNELPEILRKRLYRGRDSKKVKDTEYYNLIRVYYPDEDRWYVIDENTREEIAGPFESLSESDRAGYDNLPYVAPRTYDSKKVKDAYFKVERPYKRATYEDPAEYPEVTIESSYSNNYLTDDYIYSVDYKENFGTFNEILDNEFELVEDTNERIEAYRLLNINPEEDYNIYKNKPQVIDNKSNNYKQGSYFLEYDIQDLFVYDKKDIEEELYEEWENYEPGLD